MSVPRKTNRAIPTAADARNPQAWTGDALFLPQTHEHFRALINLGLTDAIRATSDDAGLYTFWDYQAGAWQKNNGIRIDHLLLSPQAVDRLSSVGIDKHVRNMHRAPVDNGTSENRTTIRLAGIAREMVAPFIRAAIRRGKAIAGSFPITDSADIGFAQAARRGNQCVENRLQIEGRAADDLQHIGGSGLLLKRLG